VHIQQLGNLTPELLGRMILPRKHIHIPCLTLILPLTIDHQAHANHAPSSYIQERLATFQDISSIWLKYSLRIEILVVIDFFLQIWPFVLFKNMCKYNLFCLLYVLLLYVF
jgi:hypothetical protein